MFIRFSLPIIALVPGVGNTKVRKPELPTASNIQLILKSLLNDRGVSKPQDSGYLGILHPN